MATAAGARVDSRVPLHNDKTVRRLDDFPELLQALRDGDLSTVRFLWAQLCDCDGQRTSKDVPTPKLKAAASA
jgi:hypothetical protein